jgi:quercetin dioxygenase-like cupin family protein
MSMTMSDDARPQRDGGGLGSTPGEGIGAPLIWLGELTLLKITGEQSGGRLAAAEVWLTQEGAPPLHVHHNEDEGFYVLEGEITVTVGGRELKGTPGSLLWGPRGIPHTYRVDSRPYARVLLLFSPAGFEGFIRETSVPASSLVPPAPGDVQVDYEQVAALAAKYSPRSI